MKRLRNEKGQSLVEFALVLPILLLVVFAIIDFGWLFFNKLAIENGAREGARYAAVEAAEKSEAQMLPGVEDRVRDHIASWTNVDVKKNPSAPGATDEKYVTVTVDADVPVLTPFIGVFFPGNKCHMSSAVKMHIEQIIT